MNVNISTYHDEGWYLEYPDFPRELGCSFEIKGLISIKCSEENFPAAKEIFDNWKNINRMWFTLDHCPCCRCAADPTVVLPMPNFDDEDEEEEEEHQQETEDGEEEEHQQETEEGEEEEHHQETEGIKRKSFWSQRYLSETFGHGDQNMQQEDNVQDIPHGDEPHCIHQEDECPDLQQDDIDIKLEINNDNLENYQDELIYSQWSSLGFDVSSIEMNDYNAVAERVIKNTFPGTDYKIVKIELVDLKHSMRAGARPRIRKVYPSRIPRTCSQKPEGFYKLDDLVD